MKSTFEPEERRDTQKKQADGVVLYDAHRIPIIIQDNRVLALELRDSLLSLEWFKK